MNLIWIGVWLQASFPVRSGGLRVRRSTQLSPHIEATFSALLDQASDDQATSHLLAVSCSESGAWINTLPIAALGLRLSEEVVRVAASLRLGAPLCSPHKCSGCGADVCVYGVHGLSCRFSKGRHLRHSSLNDIIGRSLESAKIPCHLEPSGLLRSDGKRPDGASLVP